jgi:hypothetical protein
MYFIRLGDNCTQADGILSIRADPGDAMPYVTIEKDGEIVFFAPFDTITFIKKE